MSERFAFRDLRELFAKANEEKSGDQMAGLAARSERERVAAKCKLADLSLTEIVQQPLIDPSADDVSSLILQTFDEDAFRPIRSMTVGELREQLTLVTDDPSNPYIPLLVEGRVESEFTHGHASDGPESFFIECLKNEFADVINGGLDQRLLNYFCQG